MPSYDEYSEFYDNEQELNYHQELARQRAQTQSATSKRATDAINEVGKPVAATPEVIEERNKYREDYVCAHPILFPQSTGSKPFGSVQIESVRRMQHVIQHGGKLVQAEPRGFGKTTRGANNLLLGVLQGDIRYGLILASSIEKSIDIMEGIQTELMDNDELMRLYPNVVKCFRHLENKSAKCKTQTCMGRPTFIGWQKDLIRFPVIDGEESSGAIIVVRSKENVRGLNKRIRYGPESGKVVRPDFVLLDDIQTDEEARSPTSVKNIIHTIKRSVLFSGSQFRKISAVLTCTPIQYGDVATHFILKEPFWEVIMYQMLKKMPTNLDMWLDDYARILLGFDKHLQGDKQKAQMRAKQFVVDNYDKLHEGAEVAWEWAYEWNIEPQFEVSALQHAMNFLIEEGQEAFDMECQCKVEFKNEGQEAIKCSITEIAEKTHHTPRRVVPVECKHLVTHIDVHDEAFTYCTVASPDLFQPFVIDYGIYPEQPGIVFQMNRLAHTIKQLHSDIPENEIRIYMALRSLINRLGSQEYKREDGIVFNNHLISVDIGYQADVVRRACRDTDYRNITLAARGLGISAKDKPFEERRHPEENTKHYHSYTQPSGDRITFEIFADVNYFKTMIHTGFKTRRGLPGACHLYHPERNGEHMLFGTHLNNEDPNPDYYEKEDRTVIVWGNRRDRDNEFLDNMVGCYALLFKRGCTMKTKKSKSSYDIQEFISAQK